MRKFKIVPFDAVNYKPSLLKEELTPEELKEVYAQAKASFTAADLQKFTEEDDGGTFFDDFLDQLKAKEKPKNGGKQ